LGTEMVLRLASKRHRKVIIASTSEVYGRASNIPFCEDDDLIRSDGRQPLELCMLQDGRRSSGPSVFPRTADASDECSVVSTPSGPRQTRRYGMVSPRFVQQALSGQPITIYGDGTQSRCFGYVGDVVRGISRLSQEQAAVDLGSDEAISINGLAEMVRTITGQLLVDYPHTLRTGLRSRIRGHAPSSPVFGESKKDDRLSSESARLSRRSSDISRKQEFCTRKSNRAAHMAPALRDVSFPREEVPGAHGRDCRNAQSES
jgi:hypothetical protein